MKYESTVEKTAAEKVRNLRTDFENRMAEMDEEFRGLSTLVSHMSPRWESPPPPASAAVPDNPLLIRLLWLSLGLAAGLTVSDLLRPIWLPPTAIPSARAGCCARYARRCACVRSASCSAR